CRRLGKVQLSFGLAHLIINAKNSIRFEHTPHFCEQLSLHPNRRVSPRATATNSSVRSAPRRDNTIAYPGLAALHLMRHVPSDDASPPTFESSRTSPIADPADGQTIAPETAPAHY